ncbi:DUF2953 domain-containing protein [Peribacillus deserti]|nr:DUF2953 domain-containing protein [Peribacillus deserti]
MIWLLVCIFLIVLISLLLIIIVLLLTKLQIHIIYNQYEAPEEIMLMFRAWFGLLRYTKKISFTQSNEDKSQGKMEEKIQKTAKENSQTLIDTLRKIFSGKSRFIRYIKKFLKKVKVLELNWHSQIGTGNAAETAVLTGAGYGIKSTIIGVLTHCLTFTIVPSYGVDAVYQGAYARTRMNCIIEFRIGNAILTGLLLFTHWLRVRRKSAPTPERSPENVKNQSI